MTTEIATSENGKIEKLEDQWERQARLEEERRERVVRLDEARLVLAKEELEVRKAEFSRGVVLGDEYNDRAAKEHEIYVEREVLWRAEVEDNKAHRQRQSEAFERIASALEKLTQATK